MNDHAVNNAGATKRKVKLQVIAVFLYLLAASIMTFPLVFNFNTSIYGIGHDNLGELWNIWAKQKIVRESLNPHNFTYTNHPFGMDVNNRVIIYTYELMLWLVSIVSPNAIFGFNLHLFLKSILAAWFMSLLLIYITGDKIIAWIGGFFYVYCPYFLAMNLIRLS